MSVRPATLLPTLPLRREKAKRACPTAGAHEGERGHTYGQDQRLWPFSAHKMVVEKSKDYAVTQETALRH